MGEISIFLVELEYNGSGAWSGGYENLYPWAGIVGGLFNYPPATIPNFNLLNTLNISYLKLRLISYCDLLLL